MVVLGLCFPGSGCGVDVSEQTPGIEDCAALRSTCMEQAGDAEGCACAVETEGAPPADDDDPQTCDGEECGTPADDPKDTDGDPTGDRGDADEDPCQELYEVCIEAGIDVTTCAAQRETCGDDSGDDSTGGDLPPGSGIPCCEDARTDCVDAGDETAVTCAEIEEICASGMCEGLVDVCPPTSIPVSEACAEAYTWCYGFTFLVNKCARMSYTSCMGALDDAEVCAQWDQACTDREAYCTQLLTCTTGSEPGCGAQSTMYTCTDWGHGFDRCWDEYLECGPGESTCINQLTECSNAYIYAWKHECDLDGDPDDGSTPSDPFG
jgi:hypothetical protein